MENANTFWVTGYMPSGIKVSFTVAIVDTANAYSEARTFTDKLLADGLLLNAPGTEAGEEKERVYGVVRRIHSDADEREVSVIDVYADNANLARRWVFTYLDTPEQIKAFEDATGLTLAKLPVYSGLPINRKEKPADAKKYLIPVKRPVYAKRIENPYYDENSTNDKKKPKHKFTGWLPASSPAPAQSHENGANSSEPQATGTSTPEASEIPTEWATTPMKKEHWGMVKAYAANRWYKGVLPHASNSIDKLYKAKEFDTCKTVADIVKVIESHNLAKVEAA